MALQPDNTARLLDVQFQALGGGHYLGPEASQEQQEVDFYRRSAILRSVSGFEIYRKVYRSVIQPEKVAGLLILRPDMPRSLAACVNEAVAGTPAQRFRNMMKVMDSARWQSANHSNTQRYCEDLQRRHRIEDALSCSEMSVSEY